MPPFDPPDVPLPTQWRHAAAEPQAAVPLAWWGSFGSEELARLEAEAQRNNADLRAAAARIAQAAAQTRAAGATLYPVVGASGSASRDGSFSRRIEARTSYGVSLDASYEVDLWGLNRAGVLAARAAEAATAFDRETIALTLAADLATTYLQYLALGDRIGVARDNLANARRVLELVETRLRLGAASPLEVAQQRGAVASIEAALPGLAQQRAQTLNALALLIGTPPQHVLIEADRLGSVRLPAVSAGLPSALLARRPDIRRAEADLVAANADIGAARAAFYPAIRLTAQGGYASASLSRLLDSASGTYGLVAALTAPIFEGGRLSAELERSRARYREFVEAYRGVVLASLRDVEDALAAAKFLAEVDQAEQEALAQARRAYEISELQFRAGAIDFLTLLVTQRSLFQSQDAVVQTQFARLTAAVGLYRALGGGWGGAPASPGWQPAAS